MYIYIKELIRQKQTAFDDDEGVIKLFDYDFFQTDKIHRNLINSEPLCNPSEW